MCCKDCLERKLGCHSHCESYLAEKKLHEEVSTKRHTDQARGYTSIGAQRFIRKKMLDHKGK